MPGPSHFKGGSHFSLPSPLAHGLVGLSVHLLTARDAAERHAAGRALVLAGAACAPDLDLLFKLVDGRNHHNNETHSIGAALVAGAVVLAVARWRARPRAAPFALAVAGAWGSHLLLDWLNRDTHPPIGLMALWPFAGGHYKFAWPLFLDIGRGFDAATLANNLLAVGWELTVLVPLVFLAWRHTRQPG